MELPAPKLGDTEKKSSNNWLALFGIVFVLLVFFHKTIILGQPVSRAYLLAHRDLLFHQFNVGTHYGFDESLYLMLVPYNFFVAHGWRDGTLSLWNGFSGWGQPLVGDILTCVLSPWRVLLAVAPTMQVYNLLLLSECFLSAIGLFLLLRALNISRISAVFGALAFTLCPYNLRYMELLSGTSVALSPVMLLCFFHLAKTNSLKSVLAVAGCASVIILSGHPEVSFIVILTGSIFYFLVALLLRGSSATSLQKLLLNVIAAGLTCFCICAPILLAFLEYLLNSECYKSTNASPSIVHVGSIFYNLLQPAYKGASPFLGSLCLPLAIFTQLDGNKEKKFWRGIFALILVLIALAAHFELRSGTPIDWLPGPYFICVILLLLSMCMSKGLDLLKDAIEASDRRHLLKFCLLALFVLILPPLILATGFDLSTFDFDNGMTSKMQFYQKDLLMNFVCIAITVVATCSPIRFSKASYGILAAAVASLVTLQIPARLSLPVQPSFEYASGPVTEFLKGKSDRVLQVGNDLLSPNSNLFFRIPAVGVHHVMTPKRFRDFIKAADFRSAGFNFVPKKTEISPLMDFSGVRYVLCVDPISGKADPEPDYAKVVFSPPTILKGEHSTVELSNPAINYDAGRKIIDGKITARISKYPSKGLHFVIVLTDENGEPVWYRGSSAISLNPTSSDQCELKFSTFVPKELDAKEKFSVCLQLFETESLLFLRPFQGKHLGELAVLQDLREGESFPSSASNHKPHFSVLTETGQPKIRICQNEGTLPRSFLVYNARAAKSPKEALDLICEDSFEPKKEVILEEVSDRLLSTSENDIPNQATAKMTGGGWGDLVQIETDSNKPSYLVLSDIYFPGWQAYVDGKETKIFRANFLFRAVALSDGKHKVEFRYEPLPFRIGVGIFLAGLVVWCGVAVKRVRNRGRRDKLQ